MLVKLKKAGGVRNREMLSRPGDTGKKDLGQLRESVHQGSHQNRNQKPRNKMRVELRN